MDQRQNKNQRPMKQVDPINQNIRSNEIFVIDENGNKLGIMPKKDALNLAASKDLDLYQVGMQDNNVAIAKILNYGKFKFQQQKHAKESKKNQVKTENREIRLTVNIGQHDLETKARKAKEFLEDGDRVKVSLKFRGREITFIDQGKDTLNRFFALVEEVGKIEIPAKLNGRFLDMFLVPKK